MRLTDLEKAAGVLSRGGVVAYPTESCYGLGCDPRDNAAVRRILRIKRRSPDMGLILIAAHVRQLARYLDPSHPELLEMAQATWPGPHTWLLPARPRVSRWLRGSHPCVAVRVTAHRPAARLCALFGHALVSTSANRHGREPAMRSREVERQLGAAVDYIVPGRSGGLRPTQIRDAISGDVVRSA